jgi:hypothetical protein
MYPERTTLASAKSSIVIDGTNYRIPVKLHIPLFFKGMKGYYSEDFKIGVFRAGEMEMKIAETPSQIAKGQHWTYQKDNGAVSYEITRLEEDEITISNENTEISAEMIHDSLYIKSIRLVDKNRYESSVFSIDFTPSLPVFIAEDCHCLPEVSFSISIDNHASLISGDAILEKHHKITKLTLMPLEPEWAAKRPLVLLMEQQADKLLIISQVGPSSSD